MGLFSKISYPKKGRDFTSSIRELITFEEKSAKKEVVKMLKSGELNEQNIHREVSHYQEYFTRKTSQRITEDDSALFLYIQASKQAWHLYNDLERKKNSRMASKKGRWKNAEEINSIRNALKISKNLEKDYRLEKASTAVLCEAFNDIESMEDLMRDSSLEDERVREEEISILQKAILKNQEVSDSIDRLETLNARMRSSDH